MDFDLYEQIYDYSSLETKTELINSCKLLRHMISPRKQRLLKDHKDLNKYVARTQILIRQDMIHNNCINEYDCRTQYYRESDSLRNGILRLQIKSREIKDNHRYLRSTDEIRS